MRKYYCHVRLVIFTLYFENPGASIKNTILLRKIKLNEGAHRHGPHGIYVDLRIGTFMLMVRKEN